MRKLLIIASAAAFAGSPAAAVELITNGGFETGTFAGWTVTANQGTSINNNAPFTGSFDARLRTNNGVTKTLSQSVATQLGYSYRLTYQLASNGGAQGGAVVDSFDVTTGATTVSFGNRPQFGYTQFTQTFVGLSGTTLISFAFNHLQPGSFQLDDVSVSVVPEPAVWGLLITGFAMSGIAMRRRVQNVAA